MEYINTFNQTFSGLNDSGCPFDFLNQTNEMFNRNNSAEKYNNQTMQYSEKLAISKEAVMLFKGLMVTRFMPSFYIIVMLFSLPLNALALVTFTCKTRVKKPAVIYMSHLACVDLLFTLLLPLKIHYQLNASDWVFGEVACRVLSVAYYCNIYCSILLMMCISVDRLLAVVFPVTSLTWRSPRKATCVCVLVWLLALAGMVPTLLVRQTANVKNVGITCFDVLLAVCLGSSSVFLDPLLYYYGSSQYRQQISSVLWGRKAERANPQLSTNTQTLTLAAL